MPVAWQRSSHVATHLDAHGIAPAVPLLRPEGPPQRGTRTHSADTQGRRIRDAETIARLDRLAIPPAWKDVKLSAAPRAKLQATGIDSAGRRQYRYHPDFRARQEAAKFQELIR